MPEGVGVSASLGAIRAGVAPEDPCSGPDAPQEYDVRLHAAAVLILLLVSLAGSLGAVALRLSSGSSAASTAIRLGTYFGFGTILATAFIHMMLPAAAAFASPCMPAAWRGGYDAWAFLFATAAILGMHLVDFLLKGQQLRLAEAQLKQQQQQLDGGGHSAGLAPHASGEEDGCHALHLALIQSISSKDQAAQRSPAASAAAAEQAAAEGGSSARGLCPEHGDACSPLLGDSTALLASAAPSAAAATANQIVGLYLAEAGIMFHSVTIGVTLGVASGPAFKTLLVALSFHQFFEGFAIGSAAVDAGLSHAQSAAMGLAFSATTPLGIAAGIAARATLDSRVGGALLASGLCDALSAGVLCYTALCNLITPAMTDSRWLQAQRWPLQAAALLALYAGAAVMAAVGRWM